jgi:hypothetical protein
MISSNIRVGQEARGKINMKSAANYNSQFSIQEIAYEQEGLTLVIETRLVYTQGVINDIILRNKIVYKMKEDTTTTKAYTYDYVIINDKQALDFTQASAAYYSRVMGLMGGMVNNPIKSYDFIKKNTKPEELGGVI